MFSERNPQLQFVKMTIETVKQYAREHNCTIEQACGPATNISKKIYNDALQLMIRMGNRAITYNRVQISWNTLDVVHNYGVRVSYPHLYKEIVYPEFSLREQNEYGSWYYLSDEAYDEWVRYKKDQTRPTE